MRNQIKSIRNIIIRFIDFYYPPFNRVMDLQTFRYAACGGVNTVLDIFLFFISYNFILHKQVLYTPIVPISPHIAAFLISFCVTFPVGFFSMKYIVFPNSTLRGKVQLARYLGQVVICLTLNYIFLKLFVEYVGIFPTPAKIMTTCIVVIFSYLTQKHFTFKTHATDKVEGLNGG